MSDNPNGGFVGPSQGPITWLYELVAGAFRARYPGNVQIDGNLTVSGSSPGGGISQLTGDVTAGPGTGSQAATIAAGAVTTAKIAAGNITTSLIAAGNITTSLIAALNITTGLIAALAVDFSKIATGAIATAANVWANAASVLVSVAGLWASAVPVVITFAASQTLDLSTFINGTLTTTSNVTFNAPTNAKPGQSGCIEITVGGAGGWVATWNAAWDWAGGSAPALSTTAGAVDLLFYQVRAGGTVFGNLVKAVV